MSVITIDVFSTVEDNVYVHHLRSLCKSLQDVKINFSIGNQSNCNKHQICSSDIQNRNATIIHSYSCVSNYKRIEETFYFINPAFNCVHYKDKIIAYPTLLAEETVNTILGYLLLPHNMENVKTDKPLKFIKNHGLCSNRVTVYLK